MTTTTVTPAAVVTAPAATQSVLGTVLPTTTPTAPAVVVTPTAPVTPTVPAAPTAPVVEPEWFYANGVKGAGAKPDWFKGTKYATVDEQAKAYGELEKRFGSFTGAPADGNYAINVPAQYKGVVEVDTTNPVFAKLGAWAKQSQLSQQGYDEVIGLLSEYEAGAYVPPRTMDDAKKDLGANADARLDSIGRWAKANLDADGQEMLLKATNVSNLFIGQTISAIEAVIAKTRQVAPPRPGSDVAPAASELDEINKLHAAKDANGRVRVFEDAEYRRMVEAKRVDYFKRMESANKGV